MRSDQSRAKNELGKPSDKVDSIPIKTRLPLWHNDITPNSALRSEGRAKTTTIETMYKASAKAHSSQNVAPKRYQPRARGLTATKISGAKIRLT
jgi:hypothetical protein